jgi:antitoxin component of MazEF toxin-antitoxin module
MEIRKVYSNGSSLLLAIPPAFAAAAGIRKGGHVTVELTSKMQIRIAKLDTEAAKYINAKRSLKP